MNNLCKQCNKPVIKTHSASNNQKFCSIRCRNKSYQPRVSAWQRQKYDRLATNEPDGKVRCLICGRWYIQVGSHIYQRHELTAREYREYFNLEVSKGILPDWFRSLKGFNALENGTYLNLKAGRPHRFKLNDPKAGKYTRSPITLERIRKLHKFRKIVGLT